MIAGLNAALAASGAQPFILDRSQAYIGVMIDDLITKGVSEPYRMFTSRAEYRLILRADNADQRLTPMAQDLGIISQERSAMFHVKQIALKAAREQVETLSMTPNKLADFGLKINNDGVRRTASDLLAYPNIDMATLIQVWPQLSELDLVIAEQVETDSLYKGYIARQARDVAAFRRDEGLRLSSDLNYAAIGGISNEVREKLMRARPATLGQASRIEGVTPGALTALLAFVKKAS